MTRILAKDLNSGLRSKFLIVATVVLLALVAIARLKFSGTERSGYYSLLSITAAVILSSFPGIWLGLNSLFQKGRGEEVSSDSPEEEEAYVIAHSVCAFILSLILVIVYNIAADPVPAEGWIRMLAVSLFLSTQAVLAFMFISSLSKNVRQGIIMTSVFGILLLAAPVGMVLNSPWNMILFFSPYYWISWAWLTDVPLQAITYTAVASVISGIIFILLYYKSGIRMKSRG